MDAKPNNAAPRHEESTGAASHPMEQAGTILRILYGVSVLTPLAGMIALAARGQLGWTVVGIACALVIAGAIWLEQSLRRHHIPGPVLSLSVLLLIVVTPEVGLRLLDFRYETGIVFDAGDTPRFYSLIPDEGLFWTLPPGTDGVNELGFRTREIPPLVAAVDPDLIRVLFLGDSVTFQGYPKMAETLLGQSAFKFNVEVINLSLPGFSSHQGLRLVELEGDRIPADLVLIAYGWNDHWQARGTPDHLKKAVVAKSPVHKATEILFHRSRLAQGARYVAAKVRSKDEFLGELRVPAERFRDNLEKIGNYWQGRGAAPILIALPSTHREEGVPDYLLEQGYARTHQSVIDLHGEYTEIIRSVSREHAWGLLDLDREVVRLSPYEREAMFMTDGIHLTESGLQWIGKRVAKTIRRALNSAGTNNR
jgi:lysophospholipase L1-like esterase